MPEMSTRSRSWIPWALLIVFVGFSIIFGISLKNRVSDVLDRVNSDYGLDQQNAVSDSLGFERVMTQLNPDDADSYLGDFLRRSNQHLNNGINGVPNGVLVELAGKESSSIWSQVLQKSYGFTFRIATRCGWGTKELIIEAIRNFDEDAYYSPHLTSGAERIINEFDLNVTDSVPTVIEAEIDTTVTEQPKPKAGTWKRPMQYAVLEYFVDPQIVGPLYQAIIRDYQNLQAVYSQNRRGGMPEQFSEFLIAFLEKVLKETKEVDFTAKLIQHSEGGTVYFANEEYERSWTQLQRFFFRGGPDLSGNARKLATCLLAKLKE